MIRHKEQFGQEAEADQKNIEDLAGFIKHQGGCGIVYAHKRTTCDALSNALNDFDLLFTCLSCRERSLEEIMHPKKLV